MKTQGPDFAIPYLHNGEVHVYVPDFIVRLRITPPRHLILETKGFDPLEQVKQATADRWVSATNADASFGTLSFAMVKKTMKFNEAVKWATR